MDDLEAQGSIERLWRNYKDTGDPEARERLIVQYAPLVKYVAGRVRSRLPPHVDQADLVSDGIIGLMDAIDKFEPARGLQFQTYAVRRTHGAIIDGLRRSDWVPRSVRGKFREIDAARSALERRLARTPEDREVAAELCITVAELRSTYTTISYTSVGSIDEMGTANENSPAQGLTFLAEHDMDDRPEEFLWAVDRLPERDRIVVALYYWERMTLAEIGLVLGVSESRVSQLHTRAMLTLRGHLTSSVA
ncbi:FliA/WhiG family RNA polymerase sigma factor [Aeromicrobium sp.]|uniref:FliA/WhiG family RNA polymerase sigma factor n=1 Tax=Aeromicrobium sp. TaxID=1871063 RepID=UPI00198C6D7A|nr:FliA/WhiG family RNA polymerase sigma factor [Aeromicrobium sp.]MBC7632540.1 FliA/WhiG family RNA polymerase sigma factor [Aeromicrobium sp.]